MEHNNKEPAEKSKIEANLWILFRTKRENSVIAIMNQADITKLISKIRFQIQPTRRKFPSMAGPMGRLNRLRNTVTALIKYERIELYHPRADESRGYAERVSFLFDCFK